DASDGEDGRVSMEVLPDLAYDTEATFDQARWIATEVDRPNLYVKIPAPMAGLPAIEDCVAHGTSINVTLICSLQRYQAVVEARELFQKIEEAGVSYDEIVETIEAEGVQKFADSFDEIVESVRAKRSSLAAA